MIPNRDPEEIETKLLSSLGLTARDQVLEIGCGNGRMTRRYAPHVNSVIGIDPEFDTLAEGQQTMPPALASRVGLSQALAEQLPFPKETFHAAILAWSL